MGAIWTTQEENGANEAGVQQCLIKLRFYKHHISIRSSTPFTMLLIEVFWTAPSRRKTAWIKKWAKCHTQDGNLIPLKSVAKIWLQQGQNFLPLNLTKEKWGKYNIKYHWDRKCLGAGKGYKISSWFLPPQKMAQICPIFLFSGWNSTRSSKFTILIYNSGYLHRNWRSVVKSVRPIKHIKYFFCLISCAEGTSKPVRSSDSRTRPRSTACSRA